MFQEKTTQQIVLLSGEAECGNYGKHEGQHINGTPFEINKLYLNFIKMLVSTYPIRQKHLAKVHTSTINDVSKKLKANQTNISTQKSSHNN